MAFDKKEYCRKWQLAHPERQREYNKKYRLAHREKRNEAAKKYRLAHLEEAVEQERKWRLAHPERVKAGKAKRRQLGFTPLNKSFKDSDGHHIDLTRVIYIPKKMHRSIWHSVLNNVNMDKINKLAFDYLAKSQSVQFLAGKDVK